MEWNPVVGVHSDLQADDTQGHDVERIHERHEVAAVVRRSNQDESVVV